MTFSGRGTVVVRQEPLPGSAEEGVLQISCMLGEVGALSAELPDGIPLRQKFLLRMLGQKRETMLSGSKL